MYRTKSALEGWGVLLGVPALFLTAYILPGIPWFGSMGLCTVRRFLGFDCPGCGLKSSFIALAHGHVRSSIDLHPLGIVIAVWLVYVFLRRLYTMFTRKELPALLKQNHRDAIMWLFIAALLLQWIVKLAA